MWKYYKNWSRATDIKDLCTNLGIELNRRQKRTGTKTEDNLTNKKTFEFFEGLKNKKKGVGKEMKENREKRGE